MLVVTGPVGVGKSTVLEEADALLVAAHVAHASAELEDLARYWGRELDNRHLELAYRNLASLWRNYRDAGAERFLISMLMESRDDLRAVDDAVPGADITVVRLTAPLALIEHRLRVREKTIAEQEVSAARWWVARLDGSAFADIVIENGDRPPRDVALEMLEAAGWLSRQT